MSVLSGGWIVLITNWQLLALIFVLLFASQLFIRHLVNDELSTSERISLGFGGWFVLASTLSLVWIFLGTWIFWIVTVLVFVFILLPPRLKSDPKPVFSLTSLFIALAVFVSLLLRLAFVSKALFPSYFDSPFHFMVAQNIIDRGTKWLFPWLAANYYHVNYHFLVAFFASISQTEVPQVMLILGQVFLVFIPFTLFFPAKRLTGSVLAGWLIVTLSAFGWYMPAHAVDWGKYPALMSLGLIVFLMSMALLLKNTNRRRVLYVLLGFSILLSVSTHSRSLIELGIAFLAWIMSMWWERLSRRWQYVSFISLIVVVVLSAVFILQQELLTLLFDPYLVKGLWITVLVLLLSVFAFLRFPRSTFALVFSIELLLAGVFVSVGILFPTRSFLTLLDRPLVEMILFIPLSILGGLGVAGLEKKLQVFAWGKYIGLLLIGGVLVNAFFAYELYPSDCCVLVGKDDVVAMDWMTNQLPSKARIGISSTEVRINVANVVEGIAGGDAGAWVTPLTGQATFLIPYNMAFDESSALGEICELGISHLYVGELGQTFDDAKLRSRTEWYTPLLSLGKTRVYEVIGCG